MNFKELAEDLELDEEDYYELLELFVETGLADHRRMQAAILQGLAEETVRAAHSIKGAASNLGLAEVAALAQHIEEKADQGALETIKSASADLGTQMDMLAGAIRS